MEYFNFKTPHSKPTIEATSVQDMFNKLWELSLTLDRNKGNADVSGVLNGCRITIQWAHLEDVPTTTCECGV